MQFMFLFKLKIYYIQHDLGFDPFRSETILFCVLFWKFTNFEPFIREYIKMIIMKNICVGVSF